MNNPIKYTDPLGLDTFNVNISNHTIDRTPVENSKNHTYILENEEGTLTTATLDINDNGPVLSDMSFIKYENGIACGWDLQSQLLVL